MYGIQKFLFAQLFFDNFKISNERLSRVLNVKTPGTDGRGKMAGSSRRNR